MSIIQSRSNYLNHIVKPTQMYNDDQLVERRRENQHMKSLCTASSTEHAGTTAALLFCYIIMIVCIKWPTG